jgi:hypothetical protein
LLGHQSRGRKAFGASFVGEEGDEFVFDGFCCCAGDLLGYYAAGQRAEGVDFFGEAEGGEDAAVVFVDERF